MMKYYRYRFKEKKQKPGSFLPKTASSLYNSYNNTQQSLLKARNFIFIKQSISLKREPIFNRQKRILTLNKIRLRSTTKNNFNMYRQRNNKKPEVFYNAARIRFELLQQLGSINKQQDFQSITKSKFDSDQQVQYKDFKQIKTERLMLLQIDKLVQLRNQSKIDEFY